MSNVTKFIKFVCVGVCNTAISLIIYYLLKTVGVNYIFAITSGYVISSVFGYFLSKIWVFKNKEDKKKSILKYYILYGSSLLLNVLLMGFQVSILNISDNIAPLFTLAVTTLYNFYFSKKIVFNANFKFSFKKIKNELSNYKLYYGTMLIMLLLISFMFYNNIYNQPAADDYTNLMTINSAVSDGEVSNIREFVPAVIHKGGQLYYNWQGTYFSNYLFYIHPLLVSRNMYKFTSFLIQIFWLVSIFSLCKSFTNKSKSNKKDIYLLGMLFTILSILFMYSLAEGVYWITGTVLYIIPFSISLFFMSSLVKYIKSSNNLWFIITLILALILGGTSYVTGLFVGFILLCVTVYLFIKNDKRKFKLLGLLFFYCCAFACNVFAPGNSNRVNSDTNVSLFEVFRITCVNAYEMIKKLLFGTVYIPFITIAIPAIKRLVASTKIKFEKPILLSFLCLMCFISFFGPMALAYKTYYQELRVLNIQFFYLILLTTICIINYYGYLYQNSKFKNISFSDYRYITIGLLLALSIVSSVKPENIEGVKMIEDLLYSRSKSFNDCQDKLNNYFTKNKGKTVKVSNCKIYPYSLHYHKFVKDFWVTDAVGKYYDVELILED